MRVTRTCMTLIAIAPLTLAACGASAPIPALFWRLGTTRRLHLLRRSSSGRSPSSQAVRCRRRSLLRSRKVLDDALARQRPKVAFAVIVVVGHSVGAAGANAQQAPLTTAERIEIASVGKTITAAEILRLADEGKLDLDDPPAKYLPLTLARFDLNHASIRTCSGCGAASKIRRRTSRWSTWATRLASCSRSCRRHSHAPAQHRVHEHQLRRARRDHRARHRPLDVGSHPRRSPPRPGSGGYDLSRHQRARRRRLENRGRPGDLGTLGIRALRRQRCSPRLR